MFPSPPGQVGQGQQQHGALARRALPVCALRGDGGGPRPLRHDLWQGHQCASAQGQEPGKFLKRFFFLSFLHFFFFSSFFFTFFFEVFLRWELSVALWEGQQCADAQGKEPGQFFF